MTPGAVAAAINDRRMILSTSWIFILFNYLYVDFAMLVFQPGVYDKMATGMSQGAVLGFTILLEIPMAMILFSRVLKYRINRWANIVAAVVNLAFVGIPLSMGRPPLFYTFASFVEIATILFILWYAWTWREAQ